jgi:hypothetical protein
MKGDEAIQLEHVGGGMLVYSQYNGKADRLDSIAAPCEEIIDGSVPYLDLVGTERRMEVLAAHAAKLRSVGRGEKHRSLA